MRTKRKSTEALWGTKQVAEFLGVPEWRVKNFSEGEAYRLPPSQKIGTGRGSRRLYNLNDILRLAIANELVNFGFTPDAVGRAVREIPESKLMFWPMDIRSGGGDELVENLPVLVCLHGELGWRVQKAADVGDRMVSVLEGTAKSPGLFVLNFSGVLTKVLDRMTKWRERVAAKENSTDEGEC
jgi:DNA-binding transcriptional MerR regulator